MQSFAFVLLMCVALVPFGAQAQWPEPPPMRHFPPAQRTTAIYTQHCPNSSATLRIDEHRGPGQRRDVQLVVQDRPASEGDIRALRDALAGFSGIKGVLVLCDDRNPVAMEIAPLDEKTAPVEVRFAGTKVLDIR
ncbi:MAG: hypothetical protein J7515_11295 [Caulobacter sp.]|nr:hypothetical protein [Caulobacter sp.]